MFNCCCNDFLDFYSVFPGARFHDFHHLNFTGNYASTFTWWDKIFGTDKQFKEFYAKQEGKKSKSQWHFCNRIISCSCHLFRQTEVAEVIVNSIIIYMTGYFRMVHKIHIMITKRKFVPLRYINEFHTLCFHISCSTTKNVIKCAFLW